MTNDTTTLNGALRELGELMADNLTEQGVTSTYDEGLTTLANKILDIQGIPSTLTLTSDKSILSYYDGDTCTLTATLTGKDVANKTVEFFYGSTSLGTATTDSTGVATKTYTSQGIGDIEIFARVGTLSSETYAVTDAIYYNTLTENANGFSITNGSATLTHSSDGLTFTGSTKADTFYLLSTTLPTNYIVDVDIVATPLGLYDVSAEVSTCGTSIATRKANGTYKTTIYTNSNTGYTDYTYRTPPYHVTITVTGTTAQYSVDGTVLGSRTGDGTTGFRLKGYYNRGITVKNLVIKPSS